MFDAWNYSEWLASIGVSAMIFGMVAAFSLVLSYVAITILGPDSTAAGRVSAEARASIRRAA
jgi:hypothetical protein